MEKIAKSEKKKKRKEADDGSGPPKKKKKKDKHATHDVVERDPKAIPENPSLEADTAVEQTDGDTQAPVEEEAVSSKTEPEVIDDDSLAPPADENNVSPCPDNLAPVAAPCDADQAQDDMHEAADDQPPDAEHEHSALQAEKVDSCAENSSAPHVVSGGDIVEADATVDGVTPAPAENGEPKTVRAGYRKRSALSCIIKNGDEQPSSCSTCGGCQSLKRLADKARLDRRAFALETRLLRREMHVLRDHIRMILQPIPHTHLQPFHDYPPVPPPLGNVAGSAASASEGQALEASQIGESAETGTTSQALKVGPERWRRTASQLDQELEAWWRDDENDWWDDGTYWGDWRAWGPNRRPVQPKWGKGPRRYNAWGKDSQAADLEGRGMRRLAWGVPLNKLPGKTDVEEWPSKGKGVSSGKKNGDKAKDEGNGSPDNKEETKNE